MPRELICFHIGQCGIQLGTRFWDLALSEHAAHNRANNKNSVYDDALSSFFRNVDSRTGAELGVGNGLGLIRTLKARAILVDMEQGVINETLKGPLADLFDSRQLIRDVSGSGNNWAHGHIEYGDTYKDSILEIVRRTTEHCDSLQSFFLLHSLGGGTGSGLGTRILRELEDAYPDVYRFVAGVFPAKSDTDVVTAPYNSLLSLNQLIEHADCVLPLENQALIDICGKIDKPAAAAAAAAAGGAGPGAGASSHSHAGFRSSAGAGKGRVVGSVMDSTVGVSAAMVEHKAGLGPGAGAGGGAGRKRSKPFDHMNTVAAHVLTNLTCSMRFEGPLNVDLNEITLNLVPFPRMHFLLSSLSPLYSLSLDGKSPAVVSRGLDHMFTDAFSPDNQLTKTNPKRSRYLACGLLGRGNIQVSDMSRNIARLKPSLDFIPWNSDGFKVGLCSAPPLNQPYSLLGLSNNVCIADRFQDMRDNCKKLFDVRAHWFHYEKYGMEDQLLKDGLENVETLIAEYQDLATTVAPSAPEKRSGRLIPAL